jgi:hypothetical protein
MIQLYRIAINKAIQGQSTPANNLTIYFPNIHFSTTSFYLLGYRVV